MNQILHIFLKDARRFWGEISLSLAITAAFAWIFPQQWVGPDHIHGVMGARGVIGYDTQILGGLLLTLVPVSWWLLITRVVQAETLVGDRQFWLTRPYEWPKLLAAKILFLLAFLYLPILIAQCAILAETGFHPLAYIPGLLFSLFLLTVIVVLPVFALATVTSNFARMTLTLLGVFLGFLALAVVTSHYFPNRLTAVAGPSYTTQALWMLGFCLCAVIAVMQYALRRATLARMLLFGIPALSILAWPLAVYLEHQHSNIDANYPAATIPPVQLIYHPLDPDLQQIETDRSSSDVIIHVSLEGVGVAPGTVLVPDAVKLEAEAPNGFHWASNWQYSAAPRFYVGAEGSDASVAMPRAIYEQLKAMPLTIHITFALTQARATTVSHIAFPSQDFAVPGFGICSPGSYGPFLQRSGLACRSALRDPPLTYISVLWSDAPCNVPRPASDPGVQGAAWAGSLNRPLADPSISPVQSVNFSLSNGQKSENNHNGEPRYLCPGSPVTFTQYEFQARTQAAITIQDFRLPNVTNGANGETHIITPTTPTTTAPTTPAPGSKQ